MLAPSRRKARSSPLSPTAFDVEFGWQGRVDRERRETSTPVDLHRGSETARGPFFRGWRYAAARERTPCGGRAAAIGSARFFAE